MLSWVVLTMFCAVYWATSCSLPKVTHPPAETYLLSMCDYITPAVRPIPPLKWALWAGPWGGCWCRKQTFSPVHGMLLMRWGNGSPRCAHRDSEDKSEWVRPNQPFQLSPDSTAISLALFMGVLHSSEPLPFLSFHTKYCYSSSSSFI